MKKASTSSSSPASASVSRASVVSNSKSSKAKSKSNTNVSPGPGGGIGTLIALGEDLYSAKCQDLRIRTKTTEGVKFIKDIEPCIRIDNEGAIHEVRLKNRRLGPQSAVVLARHLQGQPISVLDLQQNTLGDYGVLACVALTRNAPSLRVLNLGSNNAGKNAFSALAGELTQNSTLFSLILGGPDDDPSRNDLSDRTGIALLQSLRKNEYLSCFDANATQLGVGRLSSIDWNTSLYGRRDKGTSLTETSTTKASETLIKHSQHAGLNTSRLKQLNELISNAPTFKPLSELRLPNQYDEVSKAESSANYLNSTNPKTGADPQGLNGNESSQTVDSMMVSSEIGKSKNKTAEMERLELGQTLYDAFCDHPSLQVLRVGGNMWSETVMEYFLRAVEQNQLLSHIDIHGNRLGPRNAAFLATLLERDCGWSLFLASNTEMGESAQLVAQAVIKNQSLCVLDIRNVGLDDVGAAMIGAAIASNPNLTDLDVSHNLWTESGANAIAEALKCNNTLTSLNISGNRIRDEGAHALGLAMEMNEVLLRLDASSCWIGHLGGSVIADSLTKNSSIVRLRLRDNFITEACGLHFADCIEANPSLQNVDLTGNQLDHSTILRIKDHCSNNSKRMQLREPARLTKEITRLEHQSEKLQISKKTLTLKRNEKQDLMQSMTSMVIQIKSAKKELETQISSFDERMNVEDELIASTEAKMEDVRHDIEQARLVTKMETDEIRSQIGAMEKRRDEARAELERQNNRLAKLTVGFDDLQNEIAAEVRLNADGLESTYARIEELKRHREILRDYSSDLSQMQEDSEMDRSASIRKPRPGVAGSRRRSPSPTMKKKR